MNLQFKFFISSISRMHQDPSAAKCSQVQSLSPYKFSNHLQDYSSFSGKYETWKSLSNEVFPHTRPNIFKMLHSSKQIVIVCKFLCSLSDRSFRIKYITEKSNSQYYIYLPHYVHLKHMHRHLVAEQKNIRSLIQKTLIMILKFAQNVTRQVTISECQFCQSTITWKYFVLQFLDFIMSNC